MGEERHWGWGWGQKKQYVQNHEKGDVDSLGNILGGAAGLGTPKHSCVVEQHLSGQATYDPASLFYLQLLLSPSFPILSQAWPGPLYSGIVTFHP